MREDMTFSLGRNLKDAVTTAGGLLPIPNTTKKSFSRHTF
jgi:hypothetical protein